jgi:hypothetical protein
MVSLQHGIESVAAESILSPYGARKVAWIDQRELADCIGGMIRRVIVHKDDLPIETLEAGFESGEKWSDIRSLFVGGYHHAQFEEAVFRSGCNATLQFEQPSIR